LWIVVGGKKGRRGKRRKRGMETCCVCRRRKNRNCFEDKMFPFILRGRGKRGGKGKVSHTDSNDEGEKKGGPSKGLIQPFYWGGKRREKHPRGRKRTLKNWGPLCFGTNRWGGREDIIPDFVPLC